MKWRKALLAIECAALATCLVWGIVTAELLRHRGTSNPGFVLLWLATVAAWTVAAVATALSIWRR